ncbi:MAG: hypothetical protein MI741_21910 [Rhodospirillales bacterium]|nr:hypothetical protein [Rhodospirillales bacterium]
MSDKKKDWSWTAFWDGFWPTFGGVMFIFYISFLFFGFFNDMSSATYFSMMVGMTFAVTCATIIGYDAGEASVKEWREKQHD